MTVLRADPGGNFASDQHRRVLATVNNDDYTRVPFELVLIRVENDSQLNLGPEEVANILQDLENDGDVDKTEEGYDSTAAGQEALEGPPKEAGGRDYEA